MSRYTANFMPTILIGDDGKAQVDFSDSLDNVYDQENDELFFDWEVPEEAQELIAQVDGLIIEHGVSGFLRLLADSIDEQHIRSSFQEGDS